MDVEIRRLGPDDADAVVAAGALFDGAPDLAATERFLAEPTHHLLIAYAAGGAPVGFVSGVETTHPDKGTEMFLYELAVDEPVRRRGIGAALVRALEALARERGCYGMWVGVEPDNTAALRTYARAGAGPPAPHVSVEWAFIGARRG
jgi:ribosomal protein S18 acetylase RimI-like enzyme